MQLPNRKVEVPDLQPINRANITALVDFHERRYVLPESLAHHVVMANVLGDTSFLNWRGKNVHKWNAAVLTCIDTATTRLGKNALGVMKILITHILLFLQITYKNYHKISYLPAFS